MTPFDNLQRPDIYPSVMLYIGATTFELYLEVSFKVANGVEN